MLFKGMGSFTLDIPCHVDLTQMQQVRTVIVRPNGSHVVRDATAPAIAELVPDSVLRVPMTGEEFTEKGPYSVMVGAKDSSDIPIYFEPFGLEVGDLVVPEDDFWG